MTEREKRIEEMKKCVCDVYDNTVRHTVNIVDLVCGILEHEDYRKADEVRKETAKEIFKALDEIIAKSEQVDDILLYGKNFSKTGIIHRRFYVYKKDIQTLKEKFGVEVEERKKGH